MLLAAAENSTLKNVGQLCSVLFIFIFVLFLTYFVTRWIAGYQQSKIVHGNLRVIETMKLSANKYIQIIEVGDVFLVIGISKDHIERLAELNKDQIHDFSDPAFGQEMEFRQSFSAIFDAVKKHLPKK